MSKFSNIGEGIRYSYKMGFFNIIILVIYVFLRDKKNCIDWNRFKVYD